MIKMKFEDIKQILSGKCVGIAGCGGLGSNCAVSLARCGIGRLVIADFDRIEESNLNRQFYFFDQVGQQKSYTLEDNLYLVNPAVDVVANDVILDPENIQEIFKDCDVIVEAFDKAEMKQMIIETVLDRMPDTSLVVGVGVAGFGNNNFIKFKREGNLYLCGDFENEVSEISPPLAPKVGIVANMQANQVLEILLKGE